VQSFPPSSDKSKNKCSMRKWLPEELEEIPCDFCGSREVRIEFRRADGMRVVKCAVCGLAYLNPRPRPDLIQQLYVEDYFNGKSASRGKGGLSLDLSRNNTSHAALSEPIPRAIEILEDQMGSLKTKKVLEIGCATGDFLARIRAQGANAIGLEVSGFAAKIARRRGLDVITGKIEDYAAESIDQYDAVVALEVIEHVISPRLFLKSISKILCPGGILLLSTPNFACSNRFGEKWFGFNTSYEHLYFFSLDVLKSIASEYKFFLIYWETSSYSGSIHVSSNAFKRQVFRLHTYLLLVRRLGVSKAAHIILRRKANFHPYGNGHTLCCLFQR
jgi:2-polyprenyl-3-methyl-5-hydroxy-6-metoxy-1,4-benzoquinol methylase